jgi:hypothetical protein
MTKNNSALKGQSLKLNKKGDWQNTRLKKYMIKKKHIHICVYAKSN